VVMSFFLIFAHALLAERELVMLANAASLS
jgi:hypothetical protein